MRFTEIVIGRKLVQLLFVSAIVISGCTGSVPVGDCEEAGAELQKVVRAINPSPRHYISYRTSGIKIDGILDETGWKEAPWSETFVDIEGDIKPAPLYPTRMKMLWDDMYLYIATEITEPHINARLRQRDTVIFYDNDFEVFIDPDGDTHGYYEFEMNALNTVWDLLLTMPYRDNGRVLDHWDINGLMSAVYIDGTINDPSDTDNGWTIELAFPFDVLKEWGNMPVDGTTWRINFSRVNWQYDIIEGRYVKKKDPETGRTLPEYNWVLLPQGIIKMHAPETWGYLVFSEIEAGEGSVEFKHDSDENIKWELRKIYYAQSEYHGANNSYAPSVSQLKNYSRQELEKSAALLLKSTGYEATIRSEDTGRLWVIDENGRVWTDTPIKE